MGQENLPQATAEALAALAERFALSSAATESMARLTSLLTADPLAPTTVRESRRVIDVHLADSLVALELDAVRSARTAADLGSGAGLPGLPLAAAKPQAGFTLLESNHRKAAFLSRAIRVCGVDNATVESLRAESWRAGLGRCDLVTVRAVAELDVVAEYAAPLLRLGGALVAWRGKRDAEAEIRAERAAELLGLEIEEPVPVRPFSGALHRHLHVMSKASETPERFPRRPGVAEKRPLGLRP